jgi:hypothetical protein
MSNAYISAGKESETGKPWWRHLWPWLLIAGPAVTMVGCIITIILAVQYFGDQAMTDGAVKRGLKVERVVAPPVDNALNN